MLKNIVSKLYNHEEEQYLQLICELIDENNNENSRSGETVCNIGSSMYFSLENNKIPILTTKKVAIKTCLKELLWFLNGETNNKILNTDFHTGDMKFVFNDEFIRLNGKPDVIITDPPRDGMHKKVIQQIINISPKKIIYVSCNSATQARDLELLKDKYDIINSQAVDMFPQTHHVENVVLLKKK